jgi:ATP-binding cassette subfamily G (WHITE) protein 2 (SNQ2)
MITGCCWYFPPNFPRDTYTAASVWLFMMVFEVFYLGFGQAIAAFSPNELLASLLVPLFFTFSKFVKRWSWFTS